MAKISLANILSGFSLTRINDNFKKIEDALNDEVFYRNNPFGEDNTVKTNLNMNGHRVYNLPAPSMDNEAARLKDVRNAVDAATLGKTANLINFAPTSSISATNVQGAIEEVDRKITGTYLSVKAFGAVGDGVTNDLAAIRLAAASLTSNTELHFPQGIYYLDATGLGKAEKSHIALDLFKLNNIKITGHKAIIKVVNHDVGSRSGLLFMRARACKNIEVSGFHSDMSFVGTNTDALFYPESGFLYAYNTNENSSGGAVAEEDRLGNVSVHHCTFDIRSQYGAYTTSPNPYQGDSNNGGKYFSIFVRGEQADPVYTSQNKGLTIYDCYWKDTHQAYGIWFWGFSDVNIHHNTFEGWAVRTANYQNTTLGGSVPAIRVQKFFCRNHRISDNIIQGRVAPARVGAYDGCSAFIGYQQEATAFDAESVVTICNNTLVVGSNNSGLIDTGIQLLCGGTFDIHGNTFGCSTASVGATGIQIGDNSSSPTGIAQYVNIHGNVFSTAFNRGFPIVYTSASSTSPTLRTIKSLIVKDNIFNGYYRSVIQKNNLGTTYEGIIFQVIEGNMVNGNDNSAAPPTDPTNVPIDVYVEQTTDVAVVRNNIVRVCYVGIRGSGANIANCDVRDNKVVGAFLKPISGMVNYAPNPVPSVTSFESAQKVTVQGSPNKLYSTIGLALDATGLVKDKFTHTYPGGTDLVPSPTGYTWLLFQWEVGDSA